MELECRAKELALTAAMFAFFVVAVLGIVSGAEGYVAALRGLAASAVVTYAGRFPARILLDALEPPAQQEEAAPTAQETPAARPRSAKAA
jgi:hypothetical protein